MGSMDKIKLDNSILTKFKTTYKDDFIISDKLDGVSGLIHITDDKLNIYTRGNGYEGQNVSWLADYISPPMTSLKKFSTDEVAIRGEFIISKDDFLKVKHLGSNARNMVAGIVNSKTPNKEILKYVQFVPYTVIKPEMAPADQMNWLKKMKFDPVHIQHVKTFDFEKLGSILMERKDKSIYDIDGIILSHNKYYEIESGKNPAHAFAFKATSHDNMAKVDVTGIEWNVSKNGYLKPVVQFDPISLNGVMIKRATGFNAQFISKNKIGPGSVIHITRSGDVIPFIHEVISTSSSGKPQMPDVAYSWNDTKIDIILDDHEEDENVAIKVLIGFFKKVKVAGFSEKNIEKMYHAGLQTPVQLLYTQVQDYQNVLGNVNGKNIFDGIVKIRDNLSCLDLMVATNLFGHGFGERKIKPILEAFPEIVDQKYIPQHQDLIKLNGISTITADKFIDGLQKFNAFMKQNPKIKCKKVDKLQKDDDCAHDQQSISALQGENIIFTGFRDGELQKRAECQGGNMSTSMSKKITILVYKTYSDNSVKIKQAKEMGNVRILSIDEFKRILIDYSP
jgi:NAD-dependent DNA ligase